MPLSESDFKAVTLGSLGLAACFLSYRAGLRQASRRGRSCTLAMKPGSTFFLSGVMGGSGGGTSKLVGVAVESQDYRARIRDTILAADPSATVVDPADVVAARARALHPTSAIDWASDAAVSAMFGECVDLAARCDVVVSYLPMASMGSAVELHAARAAGRLVLVVAPGEKMRSNWVIRSYADCVFDDTDALRHWLSQHPWSARAPPTPARTAAAAPPTAALDGSITFLYSADTDASRRFYEAGLGLRMREDKGAVVFYSLPGRAASLGIVREGVSAAASPPRSARAACVDTVMLCLLTKDVDGCLARLHALGLPGVVVEQPPMANTRFGIYNALLRDPDGYLVELQAFTDRAEHARFLS